MIVHAYAKGAFVAMDEKVEKQTYTMKEAATILGVSLALMYDAAANEEFPCIRIGKAMRVSRSTVERILAGELHVDPRAAIRAMRKERARAARVEDPDAWAEKQAREMEIRARVKGGELY